MHNHSGKRQRPAYRQAVDFSGYSQVSQVYPGRGRRTSPSGRIALPLKLGPYRACRSAMRSIAKPSARPPAQTAVPVEKAHPLSAVQPARSGILLARRLSALEEAHRPDPLRSIAWHSTGVHTNGAP